MDTDNVHEAAVSKRNFPRRSKAMKKVMKKTKESESSASDKNDVIK